MADDAAIDRMKVLAVDDCEETTEVVSRQLNGAGYDVRTARSVEEAVAVLEFHPVDIVITDIKMPVHDGLDLLRYVRENFSNVEIMMITGYPCINMAVQSIKDGAEEYLVKPFTEEELLTAVNGIKEKIIRRRAIRADTAPICHHGIIGQSDVMEKVYSLIGKAGATLANVLISGESGTGKELVARAIHYNSSRSSAPFVSVNCTAIPDTLLESELFGHKRGAFTGARDSRTGYFQIADGGTIFLDEIGDASSNLQGKLLRVIQNKEIHVVGSSRVQKVDSRIIAATHKDLQSLIKKGHFREDLYYRLNVIGIPVPPLRERGDDILRLLNYFTRKFSKEMDRSIPEFTDGAVLALKNHKWPGNVRELENLVQGLIVLCDADAIHISDMPDFMRSGIDYKTVSPRSLAEVETEHILKVLESADGNKTTAAEILGIDRKTLRRKLKIAGIVDS